MAAAYRVRHRAFGNTVQLFFLMNAKSGLCPEDCGYCSQSKVSEAEIPRYNLLSAPKLMDAARLAAERQSKTFCIVISARGPTEREIEFVCDIAPKSFKNSVAAYGKVLARRDDKQRRALIRSVIGYLKDKKLLRHETRSYILQTGLSMGLKRDIIVNYLKRVGAWGRYIRKK